MTKITGIIAEFNPFHKGHEYLLKQATGLKIVAMSGNWMQRGEPAIFDKWTRAEMALQCGADLVVELPVTVSVQAADFFAAGAVEILSQLGINRLSFGSETLVDYNEIAQSYAHHQKEMEAYLQSLPEELSYPEKTQQMWGKFTSLSFSGQTPNHVLALAYAKAVAGRGIELVAVQREGNFHSLDLDEGFASATALRQQILGLTELSALKKYVPAQILHNYNKPATSWENYFAFLQYKIISNPAYLEEIFQLNQELAVRLQRAVKKAHNFTELVELVHTKRYTKARVRRLLTYILLDIPRDFETPQGIHVLGFSAAGQKLLGQHKAQMISKIGQKPWDPLTQKADEIYQLGNPEAGEQNYGRRPIIFPSPVK